jgi:DNA-binding NarL/FixJ family response regulator
MNETNADAILNEMKSVKMLLILQLLAMGLKQKQIALMLGVSDATMSRLLPKCLSIERDALSRGK